MNLLLDPMVKVNVILWIPAFARTALCLAEDDNELFYLIFITKFLPDDEEWGGVEDGRISSGDNADE